MGLIFIDAGKVKMYEVQFCESCRKKIADSAHTARYY